MRLWSNGPALLVLCMLFWAGSIVTGRAVASEIPPSLFTALRWGGALLIALPFAWTHVRQDQAVLRRTWWFPALLGLLGVVTYNSLVYHGLHDTTAINALLLQSATPLLILVAALLLFGERPGRMQVVAILVSILGVIVIGAEGSLAKLRQLRFNPGDVLVLLAVASYAVYSAVLRLRPAVHPLSLLVTSMAAGMVVLLPLAAMEFLGGARLVATPLSLACLAYAAVFPSFLAYLFFNRSVELVGAARAGQFMHLVPVFGVALAVAFLGERVHTYHALGIGLIAAGLWIADRAARSASPVAARSGSRHAARPLDL